MMNRKLRFVKNTFLSFLKYFIPMICVSAMVIGIILIIDNNRPTVKLDENNLEYNIINDGKEISIVDINYDGDNQIDVIIPSHICDKPVTELYLSAFSPYHNINILQIPYTIKYICGTLNVNEYKIDPNNKNYDSRENCGSLIDSKSNKLLIIGNKGFIPDGVTSIESNSFYFSDIQEIYIPKSVIDIPNDFGFIGCHELTKVIVDANNPFYDSRDNCNGIIKKDGNVLIALCENGFIPNSINTISESTFRASNIQKINIPASVDVIEDGAFAFCNNVKSVVVDKDNEKYNSQNDCNGIIETKTNSLIFGFGCTKIPESIKSISSRAFYCCKIDFIDFSKNNYNYFDNAFYGVEFNNIILPKDNLKKYSNILSHCTIENLYLNFTYIDENIFEIVKKNNVEAIYGKIVWKYDNGFPKLTTY